MFFIGSFGAIIRKGGGLPIIFAVLIFISFTSSTLSEENSTGKWNVSFYGLDVVIYPVPLAILLTYRATNDIGLINMDVILSPFKNYFKNYFHLKK
jgi:lipopolysaccharide export system permease protein